MIFIYTKRGRRNEKIIDGYILTLTFIFVTAACSRNEMIPEEVVMAFDKAMGEGDLDTAMSYIALDDSFDFPTGIMTDRNEIREFLKATLDIATEAGKLTIKEVNGNTIISDLELNFGAVKTTGELVLIIENNKIKEYKFTK